MTRFPGLPPEDVTVEVANRTIHVRAIERDGDTGVTCYEDVLALPASVDAAAQPDDACVSLKAAVGPSIWDVGTTFFVHRDDSTPRVHRFTTGLTFSLN